MIQAKPFHRSRGLRIVSVRNWVLSIALPAMARSEMPKSFLNVIYGLAVLAVPVFFAVLFLTSAARKRKRQRAALETQLELLNIPLRNRCEAVVDALRTSSSPGGGAASLQDAAKAEIALLNRAAPAQDLCRADAALERELKPWLQLLPDSYAKRKLIPLQAQAQDAKESYNALARSANHQEFPLFE